MKTLYRASQNETHLMYVYVQPEENSGSQEEVGSDEGDACVVVKVNADSPLR